MELPGNSFKAAYCARFLTHGLLCRTQACPEMLESRQESRPPAL